MATTVLSNLIDSVSFWRSWFGSLPSSSSSCSEVQEDLKELGRTLQRIQAVLHDAEEREIVNESVKLWLSDLKHVAYDADDVLDEFNYEMLRCQMEEDRDSQISTRKRKRQVSGSIIPPPLFDISFKHDLMKRIKNIRKDFDEIDKHRHGLCLREEDGVRLVKTTNVRETSSIPAEHVFGREKEKEDIIKQLLHCSNSKPESSSSHGRCEAKVSLVPIVGMGGIGKTTLAQAVFNDPRVIEHFSFRRWVFVGEHFYVKRIIAGILEQPLEDSSLNSLHGRLVKEIKNDEFLIVLDDAWSENWAEWEQLWSPLTLGDKGGKVVVTTRSEKVANVMGPVSFKLMMKSLSNEECWLIFEKRAFVGRNSDKYPVLKEIGLKIVKKFKGSPLAAKAVGSFLCHTVERNWFENSEEIQRQSSGCHTVEENKWRSVLESDIWTLVNDANNIMPILKLSYQHLSPHLKQCFAYCSIFPKDWEFDKTEMVQMWIAQGFVPHHAHKCIEDTGFDCFDDLVQRSFFQYVEYKYVMHELMHDLAEEISNKEFLRIGDGMFNLNSGKLRHVSLLAHRLEQQNVFDFEKVRTLNVLGDASNFTIAPLDLFCQLKCIRVLNLRCCNITDLSNSIGELKHLRFLDLSDTNIKRLPDSLFSLYNLQTLKLNDVTLDELPKFMGNLINLRCLEADVELLSRMEGIGRLISLQKLKEFKVIQEGGCKCNIGVLKELNQIREELCILNLEKVKCVEEAQQAMLKDKLHLGQLYLKWNMENESLGDADQILNALQPPPYLKYLVIHGNSGVKFPRWMEGQILSKLVSVSLWGCRKWEHLPPFGQLRFLKYLTIQGMDVVKKMRCEYSGNGMYKVFPALEKLEIKDMAQWEGWEGGQLFPALQVLHISNCPELREVNCCLQGKVYIRNCRNLSDIRGCDGTEQLASLPLSTVKIENCPNLVTFFPGEVLQHRLTSLEKLKIIDCEEVTSLGLQALVSLKKLRIWGCPKLVPEEYGVPSSPMLLSSLEEVDIFNINKRLLLCLLQQNLPSLQRLLIHCCLELTSLPTLSIKLFPQIQSLPELQSLSSLHVLSIEDCPEIQSLPDLQSLSSLIWLKIQECPRMHSLPKLQSLSSLENLLIINCSQIQSLPEGMLPASLKYLTIRGCPVLVQRCKKDEGPDWPKIAHIPEIYTYIR